MPIGGPLESLTLSGRTFAVASDNDAGRAIGGYNNEISMNGDGSSRTLKTRVPWTLGGINISVDDLNQDNEYIQNLADSKSDFAISGTFASGAIFQGAGQITDSIEFSNLSSTCTVSVSGPFKFTQQ